MSRDDYLYVAKKNGRYLIVRRDATLRSYDDGIQPGEAMIADTTTPSAAVLTASRLQWGNPTEHGVIVSDKVAKELGWKR